VGERLPEIVDPVGIARPLDVVEDGAHLGARAALVDQRKGRHRHLWIVCRRNSPASRPARKRPSMRMSLNSDHSGWSNVAGRLRSKAAWPRQAGPYPTTG